MGYYIGFEFSVHEYGDPEVTNNKIVAKIFDIYKQNNKILGTLAFGCEGQLLDYLDESQDGMKISSDCTLWDNREIDMLILSREFPSTVFKLHVDGEDWLDISDAYFKNGKTCKYFLPKKMPPFNPDDLHEPDAKFTTTTKLFH